MKASRLKYQPVSNFSLIALSSSEGMPRLSWIINQQLNIQLSRTENVTIFNEKLEVIQEFSCYAHTNLHDDTVFRLIENKAIGGFLSKENPNIDYFLQCIEKTNAEIEQILKKVKSVEVILLASIIETPDKALTQKLLI
ncbi:MAG: IPExxxVDY family protein [Bacteroidota bacterium]|nr:IPExxxVDY family protein [Bacteroidota bacterium]